MQSLFEKHDIMLRNTSLGFVRSYMQTINWSAQMIALRGARGVGKTTLMLQYIKQNYTAYSRKVLYCSLDTLYFANHNLVELVSDFVKQGGEHLFLDEVHKYATWSRELKEIYDLYPSLRVVVSASSLLNLMTGDSDLSRRCITYDIQGLSFREYLQFYQKLDFPAASLETILMAPQELCAAVNVACRPLEHFHHYLQFGYYPFYAKNKANYFQVVEQVVNFVVDVELTQLCNVDVANTRKIKSLLSIVASSTPFEVDVSKLSVLTEINRATIIAYFKYLADARILSCLYSDIASVKRLQKPDKIYLDNTNLISALSGRDANVGTVREVFAVNQLSQAHQVEYKKKNGDFFVDGRWTFEVGGADKGFGQIANIHDSYVLADDIETPSGAKIPLWLLGFLY
ncbi:MAG: AAA family ATPase [Bacteroidales bacterium]|nr:AAA family ATPase [Bacteroidales bacterium]